MPHLSPMSWLLMLISLWILLFMLSSISWWHQPMTWPLTSASLSNKSTMSKWHW